MTAFCERDKSLAPLAVTVLDGPARFPLPRCRFHDLHAPPRNNSNNNTNNNNNTKRRNCCTNRPPNPTGKKGPPRRRCELCACVRCLRFGRGVHFIRNDNAHTHTQAHTHTHIQTHMHRHANTLRCGDGGHTVASSSQRTPCHHFMSFPSPISQTL